MLETAPMLLAEDEAALQRARDGDRDAFADLVRQHQAMVFSIAYHFTGARDVAEELSQDVFLKLFQHLETVESPAHLTFWLCRVASRCCIDWSRHDRRRLEVSVHHLPDVAVAGGLRDVMLEQRLHDGMLELSPTARLVVTLKYQEDLDQADIASILDMSVNTVKSHLRRSIERLRTRLTASATGG